MVNLSKKQFAIVGVVSFVVIGLAGLIFFNVRGLVGGGPARVSLYVWGTDSTDVWEGILKSYSAVRSNVSIVYTSFDPSNYKENVLQALASGRGPDIFFIDNNDLLAESSKIVLASPQQFDLLRLREAFPDVIGEDFYLFGKIGAMPLYLDTMVMIYNRDLFDQAGIVLPPKTWDEFLKNIPALRKTSGGQIVQAAAAIGGSEKSINGSSDLLSLLMLQNGAKMNNKERTAASFASGESTVFGYRAFDFYLGFANAASSYYTWNDSQPNSIEAFARGKTAIIFDYLSSVQNIKKLSPFVDIGIAPMLQASASGASINYPNYQGLVVSRQSRAPAWAWDFILYVTTNRTAAKAYADATGRLPALRSLIAEKTNDLNLSVSAKQALTARSWLVPSSDVIKDVFSRAITSVLSGQVDSATALKQAEGQINQRYPR